MDRRTLLQAGLLAPASVALPALAGAADAAPRRTRTLLSGVSYPWGCDFLPSGNALVTLRNSGRVLRVNPDGRHTQVGRISGVYNNGGEGGLLGLAVSPTFHRDRWVYLYLTTRTDNRVVRAKYVNSRLRTPQVVLSGIPRGQTHNGGGLWFSDYPSLFVTTGDTRSSALAQDRGSLAGKILRLRPDGSAQAGNPFVGTTGDDRVYTFGHRNPEGIAIGGAGGIWSSELGENTWDELNRIIRGQNYGWPQSEGGDGPGGTRDPLTRWHPANCSPSGIAILHGRAWIGALRGECLWSVDLVGPGKGTRRRHFHRTFGRIRMVKKAPDNSLWIGTSNGGGRDRIIRIAV